MGIQTPDVGPAFVAVPSLLTSQHNLGGMVELVYVRVGNEVMAGALSQLQTALSATQSALGALTTLQSLHNQISVGATSAISNLFNFGASNQTITYSTSVTTTGAAITNTISTGTVTTTAVAGTTVSVTSKTTTVKPSISVETTSVINSANSYVSGYNIIASAYYAHPVSTFWSVTMPGATTAVPIVAATSAAMTPQMQAAFAYFTQQIAETKQTISQLITELSAPNITPTLANGQPDPTTLLAKLKIVYANLPSGSFASTKAWALDGYTSNSASSLVQQGLLQQQITDAITAGESSNSSQNANIRNYMFVFEQYYQSAASIITALNQAIMGFSHKVAG